MRTTPMLEQYAALKGETPDAILLYRLGDFYEMFFEDAVVAAPLLGLVLTARHKDSDIEAPMCGVPHHALESYVAKLVAAGKKVAISEQTEAASKGKSGGTDVGGLEVRAMQTVAMRRQSSTTISPVVKPMARVSGWGEGTMTTVRRETPGWVRNISTICLAVE